MFIPHRTFAVTVFCIGDRDSGLSTLREQVYERGQTGSTTFRFKMSSAFFGEDWEKDTEDTLHSKGRGFYRGNNQQPDQDAVAIGLGHFDSVPGCNSAAISILVGKTWVVVESRKVYLVNNK